MPYTATFVPETLTRAEVDATRGPLVLEFGANWCGWCQGAQPRIGAVGRPDDRLGAIEQGDRGVVPTLGDPHPAEAAALEAEAGPAPP